MNNYKSQPSPSTQQFLDVVQIKDGVVILKDGSLRAILMVSSINFSLKAENEKDAIIYAYQNFLNYLSFDIQILVRSRRLDLKDYLEAVYNTAKKQPNDKIRYYTEEYANFIQSLLENVNIMDKKFFVIVPFYPPLTQTTKGIFKKRAKFKDDTLNPITQKEFEENRLQLMQRVDIVSGHLSNMELRCASLNTQELIGLFYFCYNIDTSKNQPLIETDKITNNIISSNPRNNSDEFSLMDI